MARIFWTETTPIGQNCKLANTTSLFDIFNVGLGQFIRVKDLVDKIEDQIKFQKIRIDVNR